MFKNFSSTFFFLSLLIQSKFICLAKLGEYLQNLDLPKGFILEDDISNLPEDVKKPAITIGPPAGPAFKTELIAKLPIPEEPKKFLDYIANRIFFRNDETETARSQNIYAISEVLGMPRDQVQRDYDLITMQILPSREPTGKEAFEAGAEAVMTPVIAAGLLTSPIPVLAGLASFVAIDEFDKAATSLLTKEEYKPFVGKGVKDLLPENLNETTKFTIELADFLAKGAIIGTGFKKFPEFAERLTKQALTKYNFPRTIKIANEQFRSIFNSPEAKGEAAELYKDLGLPGRDAARIAREGEGIEINVPIEKVVQITDRPYWKRIKAFFGVKEADPKTIIQRPMSPAIQKIKALIESQEFPAEVKPEPMPAQGTAPQATPQTKAPFEIFEFYQKEVRGTPKKSVVPSRSFKVTTLRPEIVTAINSSSPDIYISSKVIKHVYDTRPKISDEIFENISELVNTNEIFKNVDISEKGLKRAPNSFIFLKKNGKNYSTVIEVKKIDGRNEIVTIMTLSNKNVERLEPFRMKAAEPGTTALERAPFRPSAPAEGEPLPESGFSALQTSSKNVSQAAEEIKQGITESTEPKGQKGVSGFPRPTDPPPQPEDKPVLGPHEMPMRLERPSGFEGSVNAPEIIDSLANALEEFGGKDPIHVGRFKNEALGIHKVKEQVIRIETANDILTAAHEVGHALEQAVFGYPRRRKVVPGLGSKPDRELLRLGKILYGPKVPSGGYIREGFAEFIRLWVSNRPQVSPLKLFRHKFPH